MDRRTVMKVLRSSLYLDPDRIPVSIILRAVDAKMPLEDVAREMDAAVCSGFVINDIFEVDEDTYRDFPRCVMAGQQRLEDSVRAIEEKRMAISYYWNASMLGIISPNGVLANPKPAPLSEKHLKVVARQLCRHHSYKGQVIIMVASNGDIVRAKDGMILP
jgi:hypothetical protein